MRIHEGLLFCRRNIFILNSLKRIHSQRKHENTIPLYERNSRYKYKKEKLLKKLKIQISHLNKKKDEERDPSFFITNESINSQIGYDKLLLLQRNIDIDDYTNNVVRVDKKNEEHIFDEDNNKDMYYTQKNISQSISINVINEDIEKKKKKINNIISILNDIPLSFIHFKKIYFLLLKNEKDIYDLLKYMKNKNFLKLCVLMNKKKCRNYVTEKEFLRRVNHTIEYLMNESTLKGNHNNTNINNPIDNNNSIHFDKYDENKHIFFNHCNFIYILEYIHYIGLHNLGTKKNKNKITTNNKIIQNNNNNNNNNINRWDYKYLHNIYNNILCLILKKNILDIKHIMNILYINDKYLYFNKYFFEYIDMSFSSTFLSYNEHEITYFLKYLSKILFSLSIHKFNIDNDLYTNRLLKRYICKSIIFIDCYKESYSSALYQYNNNNNNNNSNDDDIFFHLNNSCDNNNEEKNKYNTNQTNVNNNRVHHLSINLDEYKKMIKGSNLINVLNSELHKYLHEYKYYNIIDIFDFYTIFEINNKNIIKRFINEINKFVNIMKYGYQAKILILFVLNKKYLQIENMKTIRRLIRRIPYMLNFQWPIEFIIETTIACFIFPLYKDKIFRDLFLYMKNNIKKCIHPIFLINLLKWYSIITNSFISYGFSKNNIYDHDHINNNNNNHYNDNNNNNLYLSTIIYPYNNSSIQYTTSTTYKNNKINFIIFQQIINYFKNNIDNINICYVIHMLKHLCALNYKDVSFFFFFLQHKNTFNQIFQINNKKDLVTFFHILYHYKHSLLNKNNIHINNNIYIQSNLLIFYIEYVLFLILKRVPKTYKQNYYDHMEKQTKQKKTKKKNCITNNNLMNNIKQSHQNNMMIQLNSNETSQQLIYNKSSQMKSTDNYIKTTKGSNPLHISILKDNVCNIEDETACTSHVKIYENQDIYDKYGKDDKYYKEEEEKNGMQVSFDSPYNKSFHIDIDIDTFIYFLKGFINLKITNMDALYYSLQYVNSTNKKLFEYNHMVILLQFFSEQFITFFPLLKEKKKKSQKTKWLVQKFYYDIYEITKNNINKMCDFYIPHCTYSIISILFIETIILNNQSNIREIEILQVIENILIMFCNKMRGSTLLIVEQGEDKKCDSRLLHMISSILQRIYIKMNRRLPDELHKFCTYIEKNYEIRENVKDIEKRHVQEFISFFSNILKTKKINHMINYQLYPYNLDIVIIPDDDNQNINTTLQIIKDDQKKEQQYINTHDPLCIQNNKETKRKKAIFVIDNLDNMYLKNVDITSFFHNYFVGNGNINDTMKEKNLQYEDKYNENKKYLQHDHLKQYDHVDRKKNYFVHNNQTNTFLKTYEYIREWYVINNDYNISYISKDKWEQ
ncbi:conserved Plasmodium protein, unknown function [Plasmodium sp. DRC-Itaito]|nr:conserved Plasmodium protein, unknown function [Plasmodium sp. DRC-Itaito]